MPEPLPLDPGGTASGGAPDTAPDSSPPASARPAGGSGGAPPGPATPFEVAVPPSAELGEGPRWDAATGTLLWVDITGRALHRYDPASGEDVRTPLPAPVGFALPRRGGGVVLGLPGGLYDLAHPHGPPLAAVEAHMPGNRANDGACDAAGRVWFGTMALDERSSTGGLYRVDPDGAVTAVLAGTTISNGLGWSPDGREFYFIDSPTLSVAVFAFDLEHGEIDGPVRRIAVDVPEGVPDGMTVDAEGCLWVAVHGGWGVERYAPDGEHVGGLRLPVARVTSCCFGGDGLRDLYVTTRRQGLDAAALAQQPLAGALLRFDAGVAGLPTHAFAG